MTPMSAAPRAFPLAEAGGARREFSQRALAAGAPATCSRQGSLAAVPPRLRVLVPSLVFSEQLAALQLARGLAQPQPVC